MTIGTVYIALFAVGIAVAVLGALAGAVSDAGGDLHADASGHADLGHASPLSVPVLATFVTGFGGGGILAHYAFRWRVGAGLALAIGCGIALGGAAFLVLELLFRHTEGGGEFDAGEAVGLEAEVITPIPAGGAGEVAFLIREQREVAQARTADGSPVPRGRVVVIEKVMGSTMFVRVR